MLGFIKHIFSKPKRPICSLKTVVRHLEDWTILFDSKIKQRVVIMSIDAWSEYNYTVTIQPILMLGFKWNADQPYKLSESEMFNRFKVIARI